MDLKGRKQPIDVKLIDLGDEELDAVLKFRKAIKGDDKRKAFVEGLYLVAKSDHDYAEEEKTLVEGTACALGIGGDDFSAIVKAVNDDPDGVMENLAAVGGKKFHEKLFEEMVSLTYLKGYQLSSEDEVLETFAKKMGFSPDKCEKIQTAFYMQSQGFSAANKAKWAKIALGVGGIAAGAAICAVTAGTAAPAIGAAIGGVQGLSGAAATNAGLALLGGGAIAKGGAGIAGGVTVLTAAGAVAGGGATAMGISVGENIRNGHDKKKLQAVIKKQQKAHKTKQEIIENLIDAITIQKERLKKLEDLCASKRDIENLKLQIGNLEEQKMELEAEEVD